MKLTLSLATFASVALLALAWANPVLAEPAASIDAASFTARLADLTNQQRAAAGLAPLHWNDALAASAASFTQDMASRGYFSHYSPEGSSPADRAASAGYPSFQWGTYVGENIALGYDSPEAAIAGWMASDGHRHNILLPDYADIGVAVAIAPNGTIYYTQEFGEQPAAW